MKKIGLFILLAVLLCGCSKSTYSNNTMIEDSGRTNSEKSSNNKNDLSDENSSDTNEENEVVVFEDPNFERYIRSYLGKSSEEEIKASELAKITELVIDRRFVEIDHSDFFTAKLLTLLRMNLEDLKYFPNLTKLDIQNQIGDLLYSIDAIGYCSELTELSICYNFTSDNKYKQASTHNFYADVHGYKTLYTMLEKLPELKKLDLGYALPNNILQEVQEKAPNVTIVNDQKYEDKSNYEDYSNLIASIIELDSLAPDTTMINMLLEEGEDINEALKAAASFENLNILRILTKDTDVVEVNLEPLANHSNLEELVISIGTSSKSLRGNAVLKGKALETIRNLKYLTLNSLVVIDEELSNLTGLKSLNLSHLTIDEVLFLSSCTDLYQLKLVNNFITSEDEDKIKASIIQGMKKQTNLLYLTTYMTGPMLYYCPEALEGMTELKDFTSELQRIKKNCLIFTIHFRNF